MTTVQITLPDQLAQEEQQAGLLSQSALEKLLREQLRAKRAEELFAAMERMAQVPEPAATSSTSIWSVPPRLTLMRCTRPRPSKL